MSRDKTRIRFQDYNDNIREISEKEYREALREQYKIIEDLKRK